MKEFIKINVGTTPEQVIEVIEGMFEECKGYCYYENKKLNSKDESKFMFHFDANHYVVSISS